MKLKNFFICFLFLGIGTLTPSYGGVVKKSRTVSGLLNNKNKALRVHITQGHVKPDPIAFVDPYNSSSSLQEIGSSFMSIIRQNLCDCGAFFAIKKTSFLQSSKDLAIQEPRMNDWRVLKVRFLICGEVYSQGAGDKVTIKVYDVNCGINLLKVSVVVSKNNFRQAAHAISDIIYTKLTGEKGMFNTKLAYIETAPNKVIKGKNVTYFRKLKIMDQDGYNDMTLTDGNGLVLTPRFSPDGNTIAYLFYKEEGRGKNLKKTAHVYLLDLKTKRQRPLLTTSHFEAISKANGGEPVNMTYSPRFSPDGRSICFALIIKGKSAIYTMDIMEGKIRRLTNHTAIDTSPAYSADGKKIVFTSNRSGRENIYIMDKNGNNVQRLTNGPGKYSQPIFSPRGDLIAFSKQIGNEFFIGVIRPNGADERTIVNSYLTESPCWSPNGRFIIFTIQKSSRTSRKICMVDITGYFMKEINTNKEAYDGAWSPLLEARG